MLDLSKIPFERWAVDVQAEAAHPRMGEFEEWHDKTLRPKTLIRWRYLGFNCWMEVDPDDRANHRCDNLPEFVTLLTLDQVIEYCEPKTEPEWQPKHGELVKDKKGQLCFYMQTHPLSNNQHLVINKKSRRIYSTSSVTKIDKVKVDMDTLIEAYCQAHGYPKELIEVIQQS